jgi:hypothetical protein
MHDVPIQGNRIHGFGTLMAAAPAPDDHEPGLDVGLMVTVLQNHKMWIQIRT